VTDGEVRDIPVTKSLGIYDSYATEPVTKFLGIYDSYATEETGFKGCSNEDYVPKFKKKKNSNGFRNPFHKFLKRISITISEKKNIETDVKIRFTIF